MLRGNFVSAISLANKTVSLLHSSIDKIKEQGPESSVATLRFLERQFRRIEVQALGVSVLPDTSVDLTGINQAVYNR